MISQELRTLYEPVLKTTLHDLVPLSTSLASPRPEHEQIIGTVVDNVLFDLNGALIHLLQENPGILNLTTTSDKNFRNYMASLHRKFYSDLATGIEGACSKLIISRGGTLPRVGNPHFMDYINATLATSSVRDKEKTKWRHMFECVRLLRNKSSHYETIFRADEAQKLKSCTLGHHINSESGLHSTPSNYKPLLEMTVEFFRTI